MSQAWRDRLTILIVVLALLGAVTGIANTVRGNRQGARMDDVIRAAMDASHDAEIENGENAKLERANAAWTAADARNRATIAALLKARK